MSQFRDAVLDGTLEAAQLHNLLHSEDLFVSSPRSVDVFNIIENKHIFLFFKKLQGLLGAYLPVEADPGILVTTERNLAIQRFTAAHELGHAVLKHGLGIDDDTMLARTPFGTRRYDPKEMGADTFAAMFLMPDWLINAISNQQRWDYQSIRRPEILYQMALRLGVSYEALARTLVRHKFLTASESDHLQRTPVKTIKQSLLGEIDSAGISDWRRNVWVLTERDAQTTIVGEPEDIFIVRLHEKSSAGYLWSLEDVMRAGFRVVSDTREPENNELVGGDVLRVLKAQLEGPQSGNFSVRQARPWDPDDAVGTFTLKYDFKGREIGITRTYRERQLAA